MAFGVNGPAWGTVLVILVLLSGLRFGTAVVRRAMPVSREVKSAWLQTRMLAKRCDSFQWQKLLWLGAGMLAWMGIQGTIQSGPLAVALVCVASGVVGLVFWNLAKRECP